MYVYIYIYISYMYTYIYNTYTGRLGWEVGARPGPGQRRLFGLRRVML